MEFDVLGLNVRFKKGEEGNLPRGIEATAVIDIVKTEAQKIRQTAKDVDESQIAVLVALKLATDNLVLEKEYKESVMLLKEKALAAHDLLKDTMPSSV